MVENEESHRPLDSELKSELFRRGLDILLRTHGIHHPPPPIVTKLFTSPWKMDIEDVNFILEKLGDAIPGEISDNAKFYAKKHTKEQFIETNNDLSMKSEQKSDEELSEKPAIREREIDNSYIPLRITTKEKNCELLSRDLSRLLVNRNVPISSMIVDLYAQRRNVHYEDKIKVLSSLGWQKTRISGVDVDMYAKDLMIPKPEVEPEPVNDEDRPYKEPTRIVVNPRPTAHTHLRLPTEDMDFDDDYYPDSSYWLKTLA